jgi:predicted DNA-binding transcriptional regulator
VVYKYFLEALVDWYSTGLGESLVLKEKMMISCRFVLKKKVFSLAIQREREMVEGGVVGFIVTKSPPSLVVVAKPYPLETLVFCLSNS